MVIKAGYKVGVNTSPHLSEFTERIQINGEQITKNDVITYANLLCGIRERINSETEVGYATYFEVVTAIALKYFADKNVDYVILEVGLGGTYDATNIVSPIITIITSISCPVAPSSSVTVSTTSYIPSMEYAWVAGVPEAVVPSPKSHEYVSVDISEGESTASPLKVRTSPARTMEHGDVQVAIASGGMFFTVTWRESDAENPS